MVYISEAINSVTMIVMMRKVVSVVIGSFALASIGLGIFPANPALGTELDGFAINTEDKSVTVTLFTDQRAIYTTEQQGKQFTIVLPDTQLSDEQLQNGLPVVIDNKNRFIGRAVPGEAGKVKIILPNLPASDYSVSIQQKHPKVASATPQPVPSLKPRPAVKEETVSQFEKVAANFPEPKPVKEPVKVSAASPMKLSPAPVRSSNGSMWNPYVVRQPAQQNHVAATPKKAVPKATTALQDEPINTISVAESFNPPASSGNTSDPLWYLHSLPPAAAQVLPLDDLQGPATDSVLTLSKPPGSEAKATQTAKPTLSLARRAASELKDFARSLPRWAVITVAVFLGGMGLFTLAGGLVLLRLLFSQVRQQFGPNGPIPSPVATLYAPPGTNLDFGLGTHGKANPHASRPAYGHALFEDTASIQAMDYLKGSSTNVAQAVQNTVLVKFPSYRRPTGRMAR